VIAMALELVQMFGDVKIIPPGYLAIIVNVLNMALRFITKAPLGLTEDAIEQK
jgi:hypothetical protein